MTPVDLTEVLELVNAGRKAQGKRPLKKLPKGERGHAGSCPLARAFGCQVGRSSASDSGLATIWPATLAAPSARGRGRTRVVLPVTLSRFVRAFDDGVYPELVR